MHKLSETLKHYGISRATLYRWIDKGCPVHRTKTVPYFDWEEVDEWIKSN